MIVFFEVQEWEKTEIAKAFKDAVQTPDKLTAENVSKYQDAEIISVFVYSQLTREILDKLPSLRFVATRSTGFEHIDLVYCKEKNITVCNVPEYGSNTVAEFTFGLMLALTRKIVQSKEQAKAINFDHAKLIGTDLNGKTLGIIGLGRIGQNVLQMAKGFGLKVVVFTEHQDENLAQKLDFTYVDLQTLLIKSDIITLHLPLTPETKHIINTENILLCKKGSFLINTARGGLVDTKAILVGLEQEILAGVALDVLEEENELIDEAALLSTQSLHAEQLKTILMNHQLLNHPQVLITPHNAFNTKEALRRITKTTIENITQFESESPINVVNG